MNTPDVSFESLDTALVRAALGDEARTFRLDFLDTCGSTNTLLLERAQAGAPSGSVLACERQTAGRGRRGRAWCSAPGAGLTFSVLWRFPPETPLSGLSLAVGVALARALENFGAAGIGLKWPNDVLAGGRKLAGVLIEMATAEPGAMVIGVGLNVRLPRELDAAVRAQAAALDEVLAFPPSRNLLLARLLAELAGVLRDFARGGFAALRDEWLTRHALADADVRLSHDARVIAEGRCVGVDRDGALLLRTARGVERVISGELTLRAA